VLLCPLWLFVFLTPHTIRSEVRFQRIELVGEILDFVVEQTSHGNHAGQFAVAIDYGQMTDMFFEHELERFIGGGIAMKSLVLTTAPPAVVILIFTRD